MATGEILLETRRIGVFLRVTAIDVDSGTEVVFQAPSYSSKDALLRLASNKLRYVMQKGAAGDKR